MPWLVLFKGVLNSLLYEYFRVPPRNGYCIHRNKAMCYFKNWKLHSVNDEPAVLCRNGDTAWYQNGSKHRLSGPAVVHADNTCEWWVDGVFIRYGQKPLPVKDEPNWVKEGF